mgnify:CR=1 FL=1
MLGARHKEGIWPLCTKYAPIGTVLKAENAAIQALRTTQIFGHLQPTAQRKPFTFKPQILYAQVAEELLIW